MSQIDNILELIDAGLGSSLNTSMVDDNRGQCWRCQSHYRPMTARMDGACEACVAWLLGEGDDPMSPKPRVQGPANWVDDQVEPVACWDAGGICPLGLERDNYNRETGALSCTDCPDCPG